MLMMSKTKIYVSIGILMFFVLVVDSNAYQNTVSNSDQIKPLVQVNNSDHVQALTNEQVNDQAWLIMLNPVVVQK